MTRSFNPVYSDRAESIFPTMSKLARKVGAINLGQGFPDEDGPLAIREAAAQAIIDGPNQYVPVEGTPELREAVARDNKRFYGLDIDPMSETLVVSGATEGLAAAFQGLLVPGDEAVLLAPFYESYAPQIEAAGGVIRFVDLEPPSWRLDAKALEAAITAKTKLIVINTPHNPLGKVMSMAELEIVADAARRHDLYVVCDEVYERLVFDGERHVPLMTLPGMRERAIRIGSAGKSFSLTGFRIGYVTASAPLITALMKAHTHLAYTSPGAIETAVAAGLNLGDDYFENFAADMQGKRDLFASGLAAAGFETLACEGTYFITVDIRSVGRDDDTAFCKEITEKAKVAAVPISAFYHPSQTGAPRYYARFCFCKRPDVLEEASRRLKAYFGGR
ncbi:aminotransferase [Hyphococcus luteus]|uniref:Aminotransferase n=1 Tax=Hyphococcus luteus TaxID=2058213 RepID=A0A2S7K863_9PROT|nr:aminotransferase [Marinicaulis flavus]PQA88668.1 aminotransferase [Marinicaulis flavus]